ncbi:Silent information regulator protein Sir2 [Pseudopedobacter saltans DSM 12145]|uniref:protein acetyllysine N-acetyltransferase n=1 Tax=Pseudopedobacter saltans (strain ATCC 51119 / DSM 12145 / JCM 21818 / CCUG 39354 / LMG 10337 / NBRC 100064 / NCIMB 13643) TaxID=762903 RepID=F0S5X8_PSESL|nr:Sir2 family NAD-dependent protein deacetylase [Pseudopedobacter saltans]ADY51049.1 Silent information regulator protein Sir2 [Pseudopedobacter saltans DSM 12145]
MKNIVVLTGAGISAESGIATFRDQNGLWEKHRIEDVATPEGWLKNPELVLNFYNLRRQQAKTVKPNYAHIKLKELEKDFNVHIVTQNVDYLHEEAGSSNIIKLHGSLFSRCSDRNKTIKAKVFDDMIFGDLAPDGGFWRPDIVWFGEAVPEIENAIPIFRKADACIIIGTSMQVYPAAGLTQYLPHDSEIIILDVNTPPANNSRAKIHYVTKKATEVLMRLLGCLKSNC